jgi:hypothetical protein
MHAKIVVYSQAFIESGRRSKNYSGLPGCETLDEALANAHLIAYQSGACAAVRD